MTNQELLNQCELSKGSCADGCVENRGLRVFAPEDHHDKAHFVLAFRRLVVRPAVESIVHDPGESAKIILAVHEVVANALYHGKKTRIALVPHEEALSVIVQNHLGGDESMRNGYGSTLIGDTEGIMDIDSDEIYNTRQTHAYIRGSKLAA